MNKHDINSEPPIGTLWAAQPGVRMHRNLHGHSCSESFTSAGWQHYDIQDSDSKDTKSHLDSEKCTILQKKVKEPLYIATENLGCTHIIQIIDHIWRKKIMQMKVPQFNASEIRTDRVSVLFFLHQKNL